MEGLAHQTRMPKGPPCVREGLAQRLVTSVACASGKDVSNEEKYQFERGTSDTDICFIYTYLM